MIMILVHKNTWASNYNICLVMGVFTHPNAIF